MAGRISAQDFNKAIVSLHNLSQTSEVGLWRRSHLIRSSGLTGLRLVRDDHGSAAGGAACNTINIDQPCIDDDTDEEALAAPQVATKLNSQIIFDIIHSPTYEVPVLYVYGRATQSSLGSSLCDERDSPCTSKPFVLPVAQVTGQMSVTDHPWLSIPVMFIHPCRTGETMRSICGDSDMSPLAYMVAWCGLVGGVAGVNVPMDMATFSEVDQPSIAPARNSST